MRILQDLHARVISYRRKVARVGNPARDVGAGSSDSGYAILAGAKDVSLRRGVFRVIGGGILVVSWGEPTP